MKLLEEQGRKIIVKQMPLLSYTLQAAFLYFASGLFIAWKQASSV